MCGTSRTTSHITQHFIYRLDPVPWDMPEFDREIDDLDAVFDQARLNEDERLVLELLIASGLQYAEQCGRPDEFAWVGVSRGQLERMLSSRWLKINAAAKWHFLVWMLTLGRHDRLIFQNRPRFSISLYSLTASLKRGLAWLCDDGQLERRCEYRDGVRIDLFFPTPRLVETLNEFGYLRYRI